jgi:hypothetical protein
MGNDIRSDEDTVKKSCTDLEEGKPAVGQKGGVTPDCAATDPVR